MWSCAKKFCLIKIFCFFCYSQQIQQAVPIFHHQTANSSLSQVLKQFSAVNPAGQTSSQPTPITTTTITSFSAPKATSQTQAAAKVAEPPSNPPKPGSQ
jgi:hypothetical protein